MPQRKRGVPVASWADRPQALKLDLARDWPKLEKALGACLPSHVRAELTTLTDNFLGQAAREVEPLDNAKKRIESITKAATYFREALLANDGSDAHVYSDGLISRAFANRHRSFATQQRQIGDLIDSCIEATLVLEADSAAEIKVINYWNKWVIQITALFKRHNLPTGARMDWGDLRKTSPFVNFIAVFETHIPTSARQRKVSDDALAGMIRKARANRDSKRRAPNAG